MSDGYLCVYNPLQIKSLKGKFGAYSLYDNNKTVSMHIFANQIDLDEFDNFCNELKKAQQLFDECIRAVEYHKNKAEEQTDEAE